MGSIAQKMTRAWRHATSSAAEARRAFPETTLTAIAEAIDAGERTHRGEVRLIVEKALPFDAAWDGITNRQRALALFADYGVNILGSSVIVRKDYLAEHGEAMKGFLAALQKGKADVAANPEEALAIFMEARPDSDEAQIALELKVMPAYEHTAASEGKPYGWVADADLAQTISLLEQYSAMPAGLTPADIYDGSYLPTE